MTRISTALFALLAAVGLAHAGGSNDDALARKIAQHNAQSASQTAVSLRQATGGQFHAVRVSATLATCDSSTPDIVVHDDGEAENGHGWGPTANVGRLADKFTPTSYPATVGTVCASFITVADVSAFNFTIAVYADDGDGGAPGTLLGSEPFVAHPTPFTSAPFTPSFESFDLSDLNLDIQSGSVYISIEWNAAVEPAGVFLSSDESPSTPGAGGYYGADGGDWMPFAGDDDFGDVQALMVRATMPAVGPHAPSVKKTFAPSLIMGGETSTLTITLDNSSQPTAATLNADLVDTLPAGLIVAPTPNAATTCTSGVVTAVASGTSVTLASGAEIPANGNCTITVDVTSSIDGLYENAIAADALQTSHGNNAAQAAALLKVGVTFPEPYCSFDVDAAGDVEPISRVVFDGIDNTSDPALNVSPALEDFTGVIGAVTGGTTVEMAVEGNTGGGYTDVIQVYVDWNQDGDFGDDGETFPIGSITASTGSDGQQAIADIDVPLDAIPGNTRMRITKNYNSAAAACASIGFGQAEDYTLTVAAPVVYTVTPSVGSGSGSIDPATAQSVYENATATFALTPDPGYVIDTVGGTCGGTLTGGSFETDPVTADCTVVANFALGFPTVSKTFDPLQIDESDTSTVIITLSNPTASDATLTAPLVDSLPTGLDATAATTTCGLLSRSNGDPVVNATSITLPAGTVLPAGSTCEIRATVQVLDGPGSYVNTIPVDGLQTDQGNNAVATEATLTVTGTPVIGVTPSELSATLATDTTTTQTLTIANSGNDDLAWGINESLARAAGPAGPPERASPKVNSPRMPTARDRVLAPMAEGIGDGGFEEGDPNPYWDAYSENFGSVICDSVCSNTAENAPHSGSWWAWFGGIDAPENGYVSQEATIAPGIAALSFWVKVPHASGLAGDYLAVSIDGNELWRLTADAASEYLATYQQVAVDVSAYADGSSHTIRFDSEVLGGGVDVSNFMLDDVSFEAGVGSPCSIPADVTWLSVDQASGTTAAGSSSSVVVTFDASGMGPGTYDANLCVDSNDPVNPVVPVPVSMTVTPSGTQFAVTPSVGTGTGAISPDQPVQVDQYGSATFTLTPGEKQQVANVGGTCGGTLSGNTFTTGPVTEACTVVANFEPLPFPLPYCSATFPSSIEPISRVVFTGIDNASDPTVGASPALENFLDVAGGQVSLGGVYGMQVEGNTDGNFTTKIRVYIDWNQNGVFDANEGSSLSDLVNSTGEDGKQATGDITVPADALLGPTRMRVIKLFNTPPDACNAGGYGQAEDYTITVDDNPLPLPAADVSPGFLSLTAAQGTHVPSTDSGTVTVMNNGEGRLTFTVKRALAESAVGGGDISRSALLQDAERREARRNDAARAARLGIPLFHPQNDVITALANGGAPLRGNVVLANDPQCEVGTDGLVVHDGNGAPDNGYGWNATAGTDTKIVDKFTPESYPSTYSTICVSMLTLGTYTSAPIKIVVYADDGPGGAPGTELGSMDVTATSIAAGDLLQSFQAFDISSMGLSIDSGSVYIGVGWDATVYGDLFLAADETSDVDAGGYMYSAGAWDPSIDVQPDYRAMFIRAIEEPVGPPGVGCDNPSNVPWLSATPTSGLINGLGSTDVTVTADASGLDVGTHEGLLCIDTNDPVHPRFEISVSFEVTPDADSDIIFQDGFDGLSAGDPGVFTDRDAFLGAIAPASYHEEDFSTAPSGLVTAPLSFTGAGASYSVYSSAAYDPATDKGGLFNPTGAISVNSTSNRIVVTITSGNVLAIGGNFWATDAAFDPSGTTVTLTLSDGTTESYTSTGPDDFRGFITSEPITRLEVDAPNAGSDASWPVLDNLVIGTAN